MILSQRFPDRISFGCTGGPEFATDIVSTESGAEFRNGIRQFPLRTYDVSHAARVEKLAQRLLDFFTVAHGRLNTFRFKDWGDYRAFPGQGGFIDLGGGEYQMFKRYKVGADYHDRLIKRPLLNNALTVDGNIGGTIDADTGVLTGGTGVPTGWTGEFDILARFDTDRMDQEILNKSKSGGLISAWNGVPIVEVRE